MQPFTTEVHIFTRVELSDWSRMYQSKDSVVGISISKSGVLQVQLCMEGLTGGFFRALCLYTCVHIHQCSHVCVIFFAESSQLFSENVFADVLAKVLCWIRTSLQVVLSHFRQRILLVSVETDSKDAISINYPSVTFSFSSALFNF